MRLIDADALKKQIEDFHCKDCNNYNFVKCRACHIDDAISYLDDAPTVGGWISVKEVANIIADLFGDGCACNSNDIDEWLPQYCEYRDTDCPHPPGVACWEQYLKHLDKKPNGGG